MLRVAEEYPELTLVIDARFRTLTDTVIPSSVNIIEYPRQRLKEPGSFLSRLSLYLGFLRKLRSASSDCIIDMEGERFSGVLSRLSGARNRYGPTGKNAHRFYKIRASLITRITAIMHLVKFSMYSLAARLRQTYFPTVFHLKPPMQQRRFYNAAQLRRHSSLFTLARARITKSGR